MQNLTFAYFWKKKKAKSTQRYITTRSKMQNMVIDIKTLYFKQIFLQLDQLGAQ